ncbi:MAG TPA: hypothetical protein VGG28_26050 [Kofleriaceae bacterium]
MRWISEYSICSAMIGAQPRNVASICASVHFHAGQSEKPMKRILPSRTRSSSARIVSSIGVFESHACIQYKSM